MPQPPARENLTLFTCISDIPAYSISEKRMIWRNMTGSWWCQHYFDPKAEALSDLLLKTRKIFLSSIQGTYRLVELRIGSSLSLHFETSMIQSIIAITPETILYFWQVHDAPWRHRNVGGWCKACLQLPGHPYLQGTSTRASSGSSILRKPHSRITWIFQVSKCVLLLME